MIAANLLLPIASLIWHVGTSAKAVQLRCEQGNRQLKEWPWPELAAEIQAKDQPYDVCLPTPQEWERLGGALAHQFYELCNGFMANGFTDVVMRKPNLEPFFETSEALSFTDFAEGYGLLIRSLSGESMVKTRSPWPSPVPYARPKDLELLPAAYHLRSHPIFQDSDECPEAPIHKADRRVWDQVLSMAIPCKTLDVCQYIQLATFPKGAPCNKKRKRVVALTISASIGQSGLSRISEHVDRLPQLHELRALFDTAGAFSRLRLPPGFHKLEVVKLLSLKSLPLDAPLKWIDLCQATLYVNPSSIPATTLEPICVFANLTYLHLFENGFQALPKCFGSLTQLRGIDISKNRLGHGLSKPENALPLELRNLSSLVEFSAWGQGINHVVSSSNCPEDPLCVLDYETALDTINDGRPPNFEKYHCPHMSWNALLDDLEPIYHWSNLEKFWVDASRLRASPHFFNRAAKAWPKMRSLDLYDNNIEVDASALAAFSQHPYLWQLLIGKNKFHGTFPKELATTRPLKWLSNRLQLGLNKNLGGCVPKHIKALVSGTKITDCKDKHGKGSDQLPSTSKRHSSGTEL